MNKITSKKIGIIGGAGPLASALLYKKLVEEYHQNVGDTSEKEMPEMVILNYPFSLELLHDYQKVHAILQKSINSLANCQTQIIAIACNSLHSFLDGLTMNNQTLVHIAKVVIQKAHDINIKRFLLFGTPTTHNYGMYENEQIVCLTLSDSQQEIVHNIIKRVLSGIILQEDAHTLMQLASQKYDETPFDGIVLGCTDLSVIHEQYPIIVTKNGKELYTLDSIHLLAKKLVELS